MKKLIMFIVSCSIAVISCGQVVTSTIPAHPIQSRTTPRITTPAPTPPVCLMVANAGVLQVRTLPTTNNGIGQVVTYLPDNTIVVLDEKVKAVKTSDGATWVKIDLGWVNKRYISQCN